MGSVFTLVHKHHSPIHPSPHNAFHPQLEGEKEGGRSGRKGREGKERKGRMGGTTEWSRVFFLKLLVVYGGLEVIEALALLSLLLHAGLLLAHGGARLGLSFEHPSSLSLRRRRSEGGGAKEESALHVYSSGAALGAGLFFEEADTFCDLVLGRSDSYRGSTLCISRWDALPGSRSS